MSFEEYDALAERLFAIENTDPDWLPSREDVEERLDMNREEDVVFLLWLSLTVNGARTPEESEMRQQILRRLYDCVILE